MGGEGGFGKGSGFGDKGKGKGKYKKVPYEARRRALAARAKVKEKATSPSQTQGTIVNDPLSLALSLTLFRSPPVSACYIADSKYRKMSSVAMNALRCVQAPRMLARPVFEVGEYMCINGFGVPVMEYVDDREEMTRLYLGDVVEVVELSPKDSPFRRTVRGRIRNAHQDGWIALYDVETMENYVVSMVGHKPWVKPGEILRELIDSLEQPREPRDPPSVQRRLKMEAVDRKRPRLSIVGRRPSLSSDQIIRDLLWRSYSK